jgi:ribosomal protein L35
LEITKFKCEKCQFKCGFISQWNDHINSKRHTGEKCKERNDKILSEKYKSCDYKPTKTTNMKLHYLNKHATKEERRNRFIFYCEKCDFGCFVEILYSRHLETKKHLN